MKKVYLTLEFTFDDEDLAALREAAAEAALGQFADREEWDEYRQGPLREPHEFDLVELMCALMWPGPDKRHFLQLDDAHTRTEELEP